MIRNVCLVSREIEGVAGAGGLKDVVRGLADAFVTEDINVTVIVPRYGFIQKGDFLYKMEVPIGDRVFYVDVSEVHLKGIIIHLIDAPCFSSKKGIYTYTEDDAPDHKRIGTGHTDRNEMNILHQAAAILDIMKSNVAPDVIHGHDGHTGFLALYMMKYAASSGFFNHTGILVTIHNAGSAYQQQLGAISEALKITGLPEEYLQKTLLDNNVNPLMAAGVFGHVNTVSPGYAKELLSGRDSFSGPLGKAYRSQRIPLKGIYNGIALNQWKNDNFLALGSKSQRRKELIRIMNIRGFEGLQSIGAMPNPDVPWIIFHGRLTFQKGIDALINLPDDLSGYAGRFNMIFYGQGDRKITSRIQKKTTRSSDWLFLEGYNKDFTVKLIASASFVVVPSRWEPCGQIDMIGQLLGALPIVRGIGGLKKVRHMIDGFRYAKNIDSALLKNIKTALDWEWNKKRRVSLMRRRAENIVYGRRIWRKILIRGYFPIYRQAQQNIKHR